VRVGERVRERVKKKEWGSDKERETCTHREGDRERERERERQERERKRELVDAPAFRVRFLSFCFAF